MKNNSGGYDGDDELRERAKKMTREELIELAEELERRAAIYRQIACDVGFHSNPFLLQHLRRTLDRGDSTDPAAN